jgi:antitoxin (DNA-binding transcriptional repressor) of toxin-antitoxin stability system
MITYVTLPEATTNITQLLDRVIQGEEIIISQDGQAIAHISPTNRDRSLRVPGQYAGKLIIPDNFKSATRRYLRQLSQSCRPSLNSESLIPTPYSGRSPSYENKREERQRRSQCYLKISKS